MSSILTPISATAHLKADKDWYGAIELDDDTEDEVWRFDAVENGFNTPDIVEKNLTLEHTGFRPSCVERLDNGLTLVGGWRRGVFVNEDGDVVKSFTHKLMNDVHEIQKTRKGNYIVASTGMDTLLKLTPEGEELWKWHMWEHVDSSTRPEAYYPTEIKYKDTRDFALMPDDRYHLNYVRPMYSSEYSSEISHYLVSALNYGIFTVDAETGEILQRYTDIDECHNPYPVGDSIIVSESGKDRVVEVDWKKINRVLFDEGLSFVKDADPINSDGLWLLADTKNGRVVKWHENEDEPRQVYEIGESSAPYEADYLTGENSNA